MQQVELRTGAWYNDRTVRLTFPDSWDIAAYWPDTPPPLTEDEIAQRIAAPVGQPPLSELARGKNSPVIIVDDLSRPTPVFKVMPHLLKQFDAAGVKTSDIRVLVAAGTHGKQDPRALVNKIGREVFESCRVIEHNDRKNVKYVGATSFGTPVYVNAELVDADLIVGVGGIYPQHTTGFGGGGKLALGVMGRRTIKHLHFGHRPVGGNYNIENDFRRNVTEMALMVGLRSIFTIHPGANLEIVNLAAGDFTSYYAEAARFSREVYDAPAPDDADVVIANAYPSDVSYTFMRKANKPILCAAAGATKIMVASNHGGLGHHGLYPQGKSPRYLEYKELFDRVTIMKPTTIVRKLVKRLTPGRKQTVSAAETPQAPAPMAQEKLYIYTPPGGSTDLPAMGGVEVLYDWDKALQMITEQHKEKAPIRVRIYPCASLQCIGAREVTTAAHME
ncbi:MAG: DUF2088 domain-containing protein [Candidatus Zixiibacteriota bacterium]|nr:MAG: DUF2088 domain-containing protein [candidate division Zixibacteria bacterium]